MINIDNPVFKLCILVATATLVFATLGMYVWMENTLVPKEKLVAFDQDSCEQQKIRGRLALSKPITYLNLRIIKKTCASIRAEEINYAKNAKLAQQQRLESIPLAKP